MADLSTLDIEVEDDNAPTLDLSGVEIEVDGEGSDPITASSAPEPKEEAAPLDKFLEKDGTLKSTFRPTTDMYSDLNREEAETLYAAIQSDKRYIDVDPTEGNYIAEYVPMYYNLFEAADGKKYTVLPPQESLLFEDDMDTSNIDKLATGIQSGASNIIEYGTAALDKVGQKLGLQDEDESALTETWQKERPYTSGGTSIMDNLITGTGEFVPGMFLGGGAISAITKIGKLAPNAMKAATPEFIKTMIDAGSKYLAFEQSMSMSAPTEGGTLLVGDNSLLSNAGWTIDGVEINDKNKAEQVLQQRANIFIDGAMTAGVLNKTLGLGVKLVSLPVNMLRPVFDLMDDGTRKQQIVERILDQVAVVSGKVDKNGEVKRLSGPELEAEKKRLVQMIEENKEVLVQVGDEIDDAIKIQFDTMTAMQRGLDGSEAGRAASAEAGRIRAGAIQAEGEGKTIDIATQRPLSQMNDLTQARVGTPEVEDAAALEIQRAGSKVMDDMDAPVIAKEAELEAAQESLPSLLRNDLELGAQVDALAQKSGVDIASGGKGAVQDVVQQVEEAYVTLKGKKNALYDAIPDAEIDPSQLLAKLADIDKYEMDALRRGLGSDSPMFKIMQLAKPKQSPQLDAAGKPMLDEAGNPLVIKETPEQILERLPQDLADQGISFKTLYNQIRPELSKNANLMWDSGIPEARRAASRVRDFISWIDGVPVNSVDDAVVDAKDAALKFYKEDYAPFFGGDPMRNPLTKFAMEYENTVGRTSKVDLEAGKPRMREDDFQMAGKQAVRDTVNAVDDDYYNRLINLLSRTEAGSDPKSVYKFMIADTLDNLEVAVRTNGIDSPDAVNLLAALRQHGSKIANQFPEEAQKIGKLINNIEANKSDVAKLQAELANITELTKKQKDSFYDRVLKGFFEEAGVPGYSGYEDFRKLFASGGQTGTNIAAIMDLARNHEAGDVIVKGLQSSYNRFFRDNFLTAGAGPGGMRDLKLGPFFKETENVNNLLEKGRLIYGKDSPYMDAIESLLEMSGTIASNKRARSIPGGSSTAPLQEAKKSVDRFITALIGPLSRVGARARVLSGKLLEAADNKMGSNRSNEILAEVLSNPDEFLRVYREYESSKGSYTPGLIRGMFELVKRAGIYGENDYESYMMALMDAELKSEDNTEEALPVE